MTTNISWLILEPVKPALLFITPTLPANNGHGAAMRSGIFVEALAELYDIYLVVLHLWNRIIPGESSLIHFCKDVKEFTVAELTQIRRNRGAVLLWDRPVHHIHVFRLTMARFIDSYFCVPECQRPFCTLDLDDYESKLAVRTANLYSLWSDLPREEMALKRAARFSAMESFYLQRFDQAYVCQSGDQQEMMDVHKCNNVYVVENGVHLPNGKLVRPGRSDCVTLLFVGTLDYFPNEDALLWFCFEILPIIRGAAGVFEVLIVGSQPSERVMKLAKLQDVRVLSDVPDVSIFYTRSTISIVPLRVGSGTRIKILEACSHSTPVVSTSAGAEGLDLIDGEHILIADTPVFFAEQCLSLMRDDVTATALGIRACDRVKSRYEASRIVEKLRDLTRTSDTGSRQSFVCSSLEV